MLGVRRPRERDGDEELHVGYGCWVLAWRAREVVRLLGCLESARMEREVLFLTCVSVFLGS